MKRITKLFYFTTIFIFVLAASSFAAEKVYFYHTDPSGTPIAMSDQSGNIVWRADYKPFGEEQTVTGNIENNEKFVGKEKDKETGLYYFGARYMKPEIGRFISPDPVGTVNPWNSKTNYEMLLNPQRLNPYAYGLNNPYRYMDSNGKWPTEVHNMIIDAAFSSGRYKLPENVRSIFKEASRYVDKDQSLAGSYKHVMSAPGQSPQDAERMMNDFIKQKVSEYKTLLSQGKTKEAYFAIGEAMHPLMDSTSPSHQGFQEWEGILRAPVKASKHGLGEREGAFNANPQYSDRSVNLIRRLYDEANK